MILVLAIIMAIADENDRLFVENLYLQYSKKMNAVAIKILHNEADAEDCVHDVVGIIIDNLECFRSADREDLKGLIMICTRNAAINCYNRNKRRGAATLNAATDEENDPIELNN